MRHRRSHRRLWEITARTLIRIPGGGRRTGSRLMAVAGIGPVSDPPLRILDYEKPGRVRVPSGLPWEPFGPSKTAIYG